MKRSALILVLAAFAPAMSDAKDWQAIINQLESAPRNAENDKNLAIACNNYAVELQRESEWVKAEALLKRAMTLDPRGNFKSNLAYLHLNHAYELYQQRSSREHSGFMHREAKLCAQRALVYDRNFAQAHVLIGDIEYDNQKLTAARLAWNNAKRINPHVTGLDERLQKLAREAAVETTFRNNGDAFFEVRSQQDVDPQTAAGLRLALKTARRVVGNDFGYRPKHKLVLLVYSGSAFADLKLGPHWAGGVYDGKIRLPLNNNASEEELTVAVATLFHEYTHAVIHDLAKGNCPAWLNEGLAQIQQAKIAPPSSGTLVAALESGQLIPLESLDDGFRSSSTRTVQLAYQQAHSLAVYLLEAKGMPRVKRLLEQLGQDVSLDLALRQTCGASLDQLQAGWGSWISQKN